LEYILDLFHKNKDLHTKYNLILLGDGAEKAKYYSKYKSDSIHFFDRLPQDEVVSFLKDCDILYDGYRRSDLYDFGNSRNKYVEYCQASKPILLSYSGAELFVSTYNCGVVVEAESSEAILEGLNKIEDLNLDSLEQLGQNAYNFASEELQVNYQVEKILNAL